jgi:hypothetical protein
MKSHLPEPEWSSFTLSVYNWLRAKAVNIPRATKDVNRKKVEMYIVFIHMTFSDPNRTAIVDVAVVSKEPKIPRPNSTAEVGSTFLSLWLSMNNVKPRTNANIVEPVPARDLCRFRYMSRSKCAH